MSDATRGRNDWVNIPASGSHAGPMYSSTAAPLLIMGCEMWLGVPLSRDQTKAFIDSWQFFLPTTDLAFQLGLQRPASVFFFFLSGSGLMGVKERKRSGSSNSHKHAVQQSSNTLFWSRFFRCLYFSWLFFFWQLFTFTSYICQQISVLSRRENCRGKLLRGPTQLLVTNRGDRQKASQRNLGAICGEPRYCNSIRCRPQTDRLW